MQGVPLKNTLRNPSGRLEKRECFWKAYGQKKQAGPGWAGLSAIYLQGKFSVSLLPLRSSCADSSLQPER